MSLLCLYSSCSTNKLVKEMPNKDQSNNSDMRETLLKEIANAKTPAEIKIYEKMLNKLSNEGEVLTFNRKVTITGIYQECILAQRKDIVHPHTGMYKVVMDNGTAVVLLPPYMKESTRPLKEVRKMKGKSVTVSGIIVPITYMEEPCLDRDTEVLNVSIPCFISIESITLKK